MAELERYSEVSTEKGGVNMIEIIGARNRAIVYTDTIDPGAKEQIRELCDQPFIDGARVRIMPDVNEGVGCTVGTTMTITDKVIPNIVGVDIGCGMEVACVDAPEIDCAKMDEIIRAQIPFGFDIGEKSHPLTDDIDLKELRCIRSANLERAHKSLGTLGGGNHFIEVDRDDEGRLYIVVHSGSRHLGLEVAGYYQEEGYKRLCHTSFFDRKKLIEEYKSKGRGSEISQALKEMATVTTISQPLAYVSDDLFDDYIHDMKLTQQFAALNRKAMMQTIVKGLGVEVLSQFTTIHNYIDTDEMILRKGAVSAKAGEKLIIPLNMRDGSLICVGKGNADWNFSAPHGAGRLMSRTEAKRALSIADYETSMEGIYSTSVSLDTLDEAPMAYKAMDDIVRYIGDTVDIIARIKPVYNFKAPGGIPHKRS